MNEASSPSLTVLGGPLSGRSCPLSEQVVLIGSDPTCQLSIPLPGVGAVHARLRRAPDGFRVQAAQGEAVYKNDELVSKEALLNSGDILWLGIPGDPESVQIAFGPPPNDAPSVLEEFLVDEPSEPSPLAGLEDFVLSEADPGASLLDEDPAPAPQPPTDDVFFVDESTAPPPPRSDVVPEITYDPSFVLPPLPEVEKPAPPPPPPPKPAPQPKPPVPPPAPVPAAAAVPPLPTVEKPAPPVPPPTPKPAPQPSVAAPHAAPPTHAASPAASEPASPKTTTPAAPRTEPKPPSQPPRSATPSRPATSFPQPRPAHAPSRGSAPHTAPVHAPQARARGGAGPRYALFGLVGLLIVGGGAFFAFRPSAPVVESISPTRAKVGQTVVLTGRKFASDARSNTVLFGERKANVLSATDSRIEVEVPSFPVLPGRDSRIDVTVQVAGRSAAPLALAVYQGTRIDGLSRDVGMPGEEIELAGAGWDSQAVVRFGKVAGEITQSTPNTIRVKVPPLDAPVGTDVGVVVVSSSEESNRAPFFIGSLPLLSKVDPTTVRPGDLVTLTGRGFGKRARADVVRIAGARAIVAKASDTELKTVVPWAARAGSGQTLEVRVAGFDGVGEATIAISSPPGDVVDLRFAAEPMPIEEAGDHDHAVVSTELGPVLVLSASGGRSAGERAADAAQRLNAAAAVVKASRDADFSVVGTRISLKGRADALLEATFEDAQAYNEDWIRGAAHARNPSPERLALWWNAILRDLVLLLVRGEKPQYAAVLAPEGRVLLQVSQAAARTGRFGVPRTVVQEVKPPFPEQFRVMALKLPTAVPEPGPAEVGGGPGLSLEGTWRGTEVVRGDRNYISVTFKGQTGTAAFGGLSVTLESLTQEGNTVKFLLRVEGDRYYAGNWDGHKLAGKVYSDATASTPIGTFELAQ